MAFLVSTSQAFQRHAGSKRNSRLFCRCFPQLVPTSRELTALGAICEAKNDRLHCIHQRHVESAGWFVGSPVPVKIIDDFFRIDLNISGKFGELRFKEKFNRTEQARLVKKREGAMAN